MPKVHETVVLTQNQYDALMYLRSIKRNDEVVRNERAHGTAEGYAGLTTAKLQMLMDKGLLVNHKDTEHYRLVKNVPVVIKEAPAPKTAAPVEAPKAPRKPRAKKAKQVETPAPEPVAA